MAMRYGSDLFHSALSIVEYHLEQEVRRITALPLAKLTVPSGCARLHYSAVSWELPHRCLPHHQCFQQDAYQRTTYQHYGLKKMASFVPPPQTTEKATGETDAIPELAGAGPQRLNVRTWRITLDWNCIGKRIYERVNIGRSTYPRTTLGVSGGLQAHVLQTLALTRKPKHGFDPYNVWYYCITLLPWALISGFYMANIPSIKWTLNHEYFVTSDRKM